MTTLACILSPQALNSGIRRFWSDSSLKTLLRLRCRLSVVEELRMSTCQVRKVNLETFDLSSQSDLVGYATININDTPSTVPFDETLLWGLIKFIELGCCESQGE